MVIGHSAQKDGLIAAAERSELAHGYLFFGSRRTGKATVARAFARYLETGEFEDRGTGRPLSDFLEVAPQEGTIGIDEVRAFRQFLSHTPAASPRRTALVSAGETLTDEAQNALLKIAEEPPPRALLILTVDDPESLAPTLISRFRKLHFGPVPEKEITDWLVRTHGVPKEKAKSAGKKAGGAPGLAHALLFDTAFQGYVMKAEAFMRGTLSRDALTAMIQDDAFLFDTFLEAAALAVGGNGGPAMQDAERNIWHKVMELRRRASYFNLNPRLHIAALATRFRAKP